MEALPLTRLVYDNMAIVVTFVYSQEPINRLLKEPFRDFWQHVENFSYEVPRRNAIRACLEIAVLIRLIDDQHKIANFLDRHKLRHFGVVYRTDETTAPLHIRELTNKILNYALSSAIKMWYETRTYGCFCGFERWRATRCNFKRGSARPNLRFFTEQRISAGRR